MDVKPSPSSRYGGISTSGAKASAANRPAAPEKKFSQDRLVMRSDSKGSSGGSGRAAQTDAGVKTDEDWLNDDFDS